MVGPNWDISCPKLRSPSPPNSPQSSSSSPSSSSSSPPNSPQQPFLKRFSEFNASFHFSSIISFPSHPVPLYILSHFIWCWCYIHLWSLFHWHLERRELGVRNLGDRSRLWPACSGKVRKVYSGKFSESWSSRPACWRLHVSPIEIIISKYQPWIIVSPSYVIIIIYYYYHHHHTLSANDDH